MEWKQHAGTVCAGGTPGLHQTLLAHCVALPPRSPRRSFHLNPSLTLGCGSWGSTSVSTSERPHGREKGRAAACGMFGEGLRDRLWVCLPGRRRIARTGHNQKERNGSGIDSSCKRGAITLAPDLAARLPHLADVGPEHLLNIKSGIERRENM